MLSSGFGPYHMMSQADILEHFMEISGILAMVGLQLLELYCIVNFTILISCKFQVQM